MFLILEFSRAWCWGDASVRDAKWDGEDFGPNSGSRVWRCFLLSEIWCNGSTLAGWSGTFILRERERERERDRETDTHTDRQTFRYMIIVFAWCLRFTGLIIIWKSPTFMLYSKRIVFAPYIRIKFLFLLNTIDSLSLYVPMKTIPCHWKTSPYQENLTFTNIILISSHCHIIPHI